MHFKNYFIINKSTRKSIKTAFVSHTNVLLFSAIIFYLQVQGLDFSHILAQWYTRITLQAFGALDIFPGGHSAKKPQMSHTNVFSILILKKEEILDILCNF